MLAVAVVLTFIAALLHIYIFVLESIRWENETARKTFLISSLQEAKDTKFFAFNQGFYNLMLAIEAIIGAIALIAGSHTVGLVLSIAGVGSMLAAAVLLFCTSAPHRGAALKQGTIPLVALIFLLLVL